VTSDGRETRDPAEVIIGIPARTAPSRAWLTLATTALVVAGAFGITAAEDAGLIDFERFMQVVGYLASLAAAGTGALLWDRRQR